MADSSRPQESRIDRIRDEARAQAEHGAVGKRFRHGLDAPTKGYNNQPVLKPPVWTWEIPVYFFIGGASGMAGVLAFAIWIDVLLTDPPITKSDAAPIVMKYEVVRACLWIAVAGAIASPALLISDLGRPMRFLNMLRVFKWRSAMSVGAWTLIVFTGFAMVALLGICLSTDFASICYVTRTAIVCTALTGGILATYTGVLLAATAIPIWHGHRRMLPIHFGLAGMGSVVSMLLLYDNFAEPYIADDLVRHSLDWLRRLALSVSSAEAILSLALYFRANDAENRPIRTGKLAWMFASSAILLGPISIGLWAIEFNRMGAAVFLTGAVLNRFCWIRAGRESANDPAAIFGIHDS